MAISFLRDRLKHGRLEFGAAAAAAGGFAVSQLLASDPPKMPDVNAGTIAASQTSERIANRQLDLAEQQFAYSKERNATLDALAQTVIQRQMEISDNNLRDYNDYKRYYQTYIQPVEKSIVMDAIGGGYLTDAEMTELQGAFRNAEVARINAQYSGGTSTLGNFGYQVQQQFDQDRTLDRASNPLLSGFGGQSEQQRRAAAGLDDAGNAIAPTTRQAIPTGGSGTIETRQQIEERIRREMEGAGATPGTGGAQRPQQASGTAPESLESVLPYLSEDVRKQVLANPDFAMRSMTPATDRASTLAIDLGGQNPGLGVQTGIGTSTGPGTQFSRDIGSTFNGQALWDANNAGNARLPFDLNNTDFNDTKKWKPGAREAVLASASYDPKMGLTVDPAVVQQWGLAPEASFMDKFVPAAIAGVAGLGVGQMISAGAGGFLPAAQSGFDSAAIFSGGAGGVGGAAGAAGATMTAEQAASLLAENSFDSGAMAQALGYTPTAAQQSSIMATIKQALAAGKTYKDAIQAGMAIGSALGGKSPSTTTSTSSGAIPGGTGTPTTGGNQPSAIDVAELNRRVDAELARQTASATAASQARNEAGRRAAISALDLDTSVQNAIRTAQKRAETNAVNQARSDTNAAIGNARKENARYMAGLNLRPDSGRFAAINAELMSSGVALEDQAVNAARDSVKNQSWAKRMDVSSMGRGMPGNQATTSQIASSTGSAATNAGTAVNSSVLQNSQSALPWYGSAISANGQAGTLGNNLFSQQSSNYAQALDAWQRNNQAIYGAAGTVVGAMF